MPGPHWSADEDRILRRTYRRFGSAAVRVALERDLGRRRSNRAINFRAQDLGVYVDPTGGRGRVVPLAEVHPTTRTKTPSAHPEAIAAAEADGVLERGAIHPHPYLVPPEWADAYIRAYGERLERERVIRATWLRTPDVATAFGVRPRSIASACAPNRTRTGLLDQFMARIDSAILRIPKPGRKVVWTSARFYEPESVRTEANAYRAARLRSDWHQSRARARRRAARQAA